MKYKSKSYVVPTIYLLVLFVITTGVYFTKKAYDNYEEKDDFGNITFVSSSIFNRSIPIISVPDMIHKPFVADNVNVARYYYNSSDDIAKKEKSVVFYENVYMPNTGVDYVSNNVFDVVAVYDGTVIDIEDNELLGKTVRIRHNNDVISVYQGLGNIEVAKGDMVYVDQPIGTSGTNKINKDLGNHLHFEIIKAGETVDPLSCIDKKLGDI